MRLYRAFTVAGNKLYFLLPQTITSPMNKSNIRNTLAVRGVVGYYSRSEKQYISENIKLRTDQLAISKVHSKQFEWLKRARFDFDWSRLKILHLQRNLFTLIFAKELYHIAN